jgi:hypothetical protein
MPDLDQIKQDEQERGTGAGDFPRAGRAIAGRPARQYLAPLRRCVHKSNIRSAAISHKFVAAPSGLKANPTIVHGQNGPMAESAQCLMPKRLSRFRSGCTASSNRHCERSEAISRPLRLLCTRLLRRFRLLAMTGTNLVEICF